MSHREVLEAMSGLLLGMFVAILSSTVVSAALPRIISDLGGGQSSFTWVVTATLLALTVSTPVWGKLADLVDRKLLVQLALVIYTVGSIFAGLSQSTGWLIACRALQGLGAGGMTALVQVVLSDLVSPRERGRYMGLLGGVMGIGTVGGPLLGGFITDGIGWRWNFFVAVPVAIAAVFARTATGAVVAPFGHVGQEGHLSRALHGLRDLHLVAPAGAGDAAGADLALLRDVPPELVHVLVVHLGDLLAAEVAVLPLRRSGRAARALARTVAASLSLCHSLSRFS
jgi:MFS family permease